ncbi:hypothetical protein E3P99_03382 [Wallemia hederae]|uniref:Aldehyde dehydrogenase domain-containing protein n=1 Tax=Wallemia hederae TaxID=1540922 RepID=A0A4T0FGR5_9BASI|nr:hypothetical protein E3P99_03382 [Wallemia hederae]
MSAPLVQHWISNKSSAATEAGAYTVKHPNTGNLPHSVASASDADVSEAIATAHAAFKSWKKTTHDQRRDVLLKAAQITRQRAGEFFEAYSSELDVNQFFADFLVSVACDLIETTASVIIPAMTGDMPPTKRANEALYMCDREPYGVCLTMAPWNAAINLAIKGIVGPLAAGNTVVMRTSELTPKTQLLWGSIFKEAGLPDGCLNIIHSSRESAPSVVEKMIADERIRHVSFTGSSNVGRQIGKLAGYHLKPCILELGGKCPVLVLDDADLTKVVNETFFHAWINAGQVCMAVERVVVGPSNYEQLIEEFKKNAPPPSSSSIAMCSSHKRIVGLVDEALSKGAELVVGSWPPSKEDVEANKLPNIILTNVTSEMKIWTEETFGPIAIVQKVQPEQDASVDDAIVKQANDTRFGLVASVYTRDLGRALKLGKDIEVGVLRINEGTISDEGTIPFGGSKDSGFGFFNGVEGLRQFTQIKTYSIAL